MYFRNYLYNNVIFILENTSDQCDVWFFCDFHDKCEEIFKYVKIAC